jgi:hypothetical protein
MTMAQANAGGGCLISDIEFVWDHFHTFWLFGWKRHRQLPCQPGDSDKIRPCLRVRLKLLPNDHQWDATRLIWSDVAQNHHAETVLQVVDVLTTPDT